MSAKSTAAQVKNSPSKKAQKRPMGLSREEKMVVFDQELWPHRDAVYNFSFSLTTNEADADDLLQETMQKAFRFIESYQQGTNPKAWLFRICKNNFINDYRKRRSRGITIDIEEQKDFNDSSKLIVDMREEIFKNIMHDEVQDAVNSLPVDFRAVLLLCDVEDFSYEEMSKILDIPIGTVRSRLHRARKMLQERLREYASKLGYTVKK